MGYLLKEALKTLCGVNQWSYAVFWKIGCQNPKLLIWEESYYEPPIYSNTTHGVQTGNKLQSLVNKMMKDNYINLLGEGLVGRVAFTRNHQWIILDDRMLDVHPPEVSNELCLQFSAGMKTIAVIPVHPEGVVQLGSSSSIMENVGFVNDVKSLISQLGCVPGALLSENEGAVDASRHIYSFGSGPSLTSQPKVTKQTFPFSGKQPIGPDPTQQTAFGPMEARMFSDAFSGVQQELEGLRMASGLKPPSMDDLFDVVGMDLKKRLFSGNGNNGLEANQLSLTRNNSGESDSGIYSLSASDHLLDAVVSKVRSSSKPETSSSDAPIWANLMQEELRKTGVTSSYSYKSGVSKEDGGNFSETSSIVSSQINSWADARKQNGVALEHAKRGDEVGKSNRKRLKPGENPRPRPKDRQMIQDRVKELREIVPNGAKCSIDALLERTIKHMLFLQSVTKHAHKLTQTRESKIVSKEGGVLLRDNFEGGATWAYEVGSQSMVCPIVVEDLTSPREMLVEMLCEHGGLFLEIADVIKGLGLSILKGVMESRSHKIWAHFIVEANRDVGRMEIFMGLVSLLEQGVKSGAPASGSVRATGGSEMSRADHLCHDPHPSQPYLLFSDNSS